MYITTPRGDGWELFEHEESAMSFGRFGDGVDETFTATVRQYPLKETRDQDDFVAVIMKDFEAAFPPERYDVIELESEYSTQREYPCVTINYVIVDKQAVTMTSDEAILFVQSDTLHCRHPKQQDIGFGIIFSHRGESLYTGLHAEAQAFFDGVYVPSVDKNIVEP